MKTPLSVLRTTTAIMVSLSLAGTHAFASDSFDLAQTTEPQADAAVEGTAEGDGETSPVPAAKSEDAESAAEATGDATTAEPGSEAPAEAELPAEAPAEPRPGDQAGDEPEAQQAEEAASENAETGDAAPAEQTAPPPEKTEPAEDSPASEADPAADDQNQSDFAPEAAGTVDQSSGSDAASEPEAMQATEAQPESGAEAEAPAGQQDAEQAPAATATADEQPASDENAASAPQTGEAATDDESATEQQADGEQQPADALQTTEDTKPADQQATEQAQPTADQQAAEDEQTTDQQQATGEGDPSETVQEVSEEQIDEVTAAGDDVVVEDETTTEDLAAELEKLREQQADLESRLMEAEPVETGEETITEETARAATEEVREVDEDDDSDVWKYLGSAAAGAAVGALVPALGGRLVQDEGDRVIVERGGEFFVRKDENALLRQPGARVQTEEFQNGLARTTFTREDGSRIVTVRNPGGFILRRTRITPEGEEIVLLAQTPDDVYDFDEWDDVVPEATEHPTESVDYTGADSDELHQALAAQPSWDPERALPLQAVRESIEIRRLVPAIDLPINFALGSAAIRSSEIEELTALGRIMSEVIAENPREIFLVEGHTDATGSNLLNLALSDRRAEAVALALTQYFDIPPENLIVQGYGERYLKEATQAANVVNRRATVRRITPLLHEVAAR